MKAQANLSPEAAAASDVFYSSAIRRIGGFMIALGLALSLFSWLRFGWRVTLGFAGGCAIAYLNFHWLERVVTALGERVVQGDAPRSSSGMVFRFLLRYVLMAVAAYVIFSVAPASLYGLFAGLFLPVGAIVCEAACEVYVAVVRGL